MGELELICFQIISASGMARSSYIEAIQKSKDGNFNDAKKSIKEGENFFREGHNAHSKLIQQETSGKGCIPNLLLLHAEDQLMAAETCKILANELIDAYKRIVTLESK
ncbi:PTS lactose/cellobiose transporter subunit IIA [Clostridium fallax]|uniref:PTS system, cellobiose-specific IIA component n=1 Tax=Clostridium fallax TaxID=1533 RepID=A0A1M4YGT6_9CLOT|nr:PTS lactose/cellobiose transporter subunit IIA [Clostridium fallax]SHF04732.1 PTS system, cellobiose-specific IIA component [Clostridium fallax]SQB22333.1 phosphotransferase system cellobiose-specific component IIA [Clostridium fallax]